MSLKPYVDDQGDEDEDRWLGERLPPVGSTVTVRGVTGRVVAHGVLIDGGDAGAAWATTAEMRREGRA